MRRKKSNDLAKEDEAFYLLAVKAQAYDDANPEENAPFAMVDGLDPNETFDLFKLDAFSQSPPKTLQELKQGIEEYIKNKHSRH